MAGAPFIIREMADADRAAWLEMRAELWPEETIVAHAAEIDEWYKSTTAWGFVAELPNGFPVGFAEVALRPYANGCDSRPVAFLEGIWVRPACRRRGVGVGLIAHIERLLSARGYRELGSDTEFGNTGSRAAHRAWGFCETERVVYFRKSLR